MPPPPPPPPLTSTLPFLLLFLILPSLALADCECGYLSTINTTASNRHALFTDLLETDFSSHLLPNAATTTTTTDTPFPLNDPDWAPQAFNLTAARARGDYGELFDADNVRLLLPQKAAAAAAAAGLVVRKGLREGMVPVAEVDTRRLDLWWGSFRASMRVSRVAGTCAAFFWYFNDTQEIDMEFLSREFNAANGSYPVNLVLQSREAALAGHDASRTGGFAKVQLPFDPTAGFHEYRIDYLRDRVIFYADGAVLAEMGGPAVPSSPGHLILQHWSNGNRYWSGGPPAEDAELAVRYVKAYFNSSLAQRQEDWARRCRDPDAPGAVCLIPDVTPGNSSAADWFFTHQGNMTNNQTTTSEQSGGSRLGRERWSTMGWLGMGVWMVVLFTVYPGLVLI